MKIYNEVISRFNEETNKWETISEDSFDYSGNLDLAAGLDCTDPANTSQACCMADKYIVLKNQAGNLLHLAHQDFQNTCDQSFETPVGTNHQHNQPGDQATFQDGFGTICCFPNEAVHVEFKKNEEHPLWDGESEGLNEYSWFGDVPFCNSTATTDGFTPLSNKCDLGGTSGFMQPVYDIEERDLIYVDLGWQYNSFSSNSNLTNLLRDMVDTTIDGNGYDVLTVKACTGMASGPITFTCPNSNCTGANCADLAGEPCNTTNMDYGIFQYYCDTDTMIENEVETCGGTAGCNCGTIDSCGICTEPGGSSIDPGECCFGQEQDACGVCGGLAESTQDDDIYDETGIVYPRLYLGPPFQQNTYYCDCEGTLPTSELACYQTEAGVLDDDPVYFLLCPNEPCPGTYVSEDEGGLAAAQDVGCVNPLACNYNSGYDLDCSGNTQAQGWVDFSCCVFETLYCVGDGSTYPTFEIQNMAGYNDFCDIDENGNAITISRCSNCDYELNDYSVQCGADGYNNYPLTNIGNLMDSDDIIDIDARTGIYLDSGYGYPDTLVGDNMLDDCESGCGIQGDLPGTGFIQSGCADPAAYNYGIDGIPLYFGADYEDLRLETPVSTCRYCPIASDGIVVTDNAGNPSTCVSGNYLTYWSDLSLAQGVGVNGFPLVTFDNVGWAGVEGPFSISAPSTIFNTVNYTPSNPALICICEDDISVLDSITESMFENYEEDTPLVMMGGSSGEMIVGDFGTIIEFSSGGDKCESTGGSVSQCKEQSPFYDSSNSFSAQIPDEIGDLSDLVILDLSYSGISGGIPQSIQKLEKLTTLFLQENFISNLSEDYSTGHGVYQGYDWYGLCSIVERLGPPSGNPQGNGTPWLKLHKNNICPNILQEGSSETSYPDCIVPPIGSPEWDSLNGDNEGWAEWIYWSIGFVNLPGGEYDDFNPAAQNISDLSSCDITGCTDYSAVNYWPEATIPCNNCCIYDTFHHFPWADRQWDGSKGCTLTDDTICGDNPDCGTNRCVGSYGGGMTLDDMVKALHAYQFGWQYNAFGDMDKTYQYSSGPDDEQCFDYFGGWISDYMIRQCDYDFSNSSPEGNEIINIWDGIWIRDLGGNGDGSCFVRDAQGEIQTNPVGEPIPCTGDARPLEFLNRVFYEAYFAGNQSTTVINYWLSMFPANGLNRSFEGIQYFEDFDQNNSGDLIDDIPYWRYIGREDIVQLIENGFQGYTYPQPSPEDVDLWEQAPIAVDMKYSQKFYSEEQAGFQPFYQEGVPGVLTNNGQFQCSDGGPADPVCYTSPYPCGMVPDFVEDCEPCGNVQYNDAGEIIEGTGGDCIPITLDTAAEGYDKISKTKQLQFSYFRGIENASDNIAGLTLHTGSLSSSNTPYYYSVLNGKQNESKSDFIFNVSFGHYAGSGSYTGGDGHKGASEVVYKQYASLLLDDINIDSGFRITSGSDVIPSGETSKKDEFIYVINFERKKFEERILESFTLEFSGSNGLNSGKNIKLTTNLSSLRESQYGSRYDIISGSAGVPHNGHTQIAGRYGHLYSDQGVIILGEKIAHEMSGSGITIGDAIIGSDSNSSHQLYPKLTNTSDSRNALRLFNCLNNVNGNCITGLRGEKEVTDVTYICRLAADDFNFTNNFSIITGSGRNMFQEDTAVMNGFPTSITSSAFTSSGEPSSLIYEGGPGVTGDGTLQTQTILEDGSPFIWPGGNVSTMHGNSHTFITGIELYDEHGEMLAVARPSTPIKKAFDREMVIKIKLTY